MALITTEKIGGLYNIPVTIGSIEIKNFNEATLREIVIYDQNGDTVISARKAMASIEPFKLLDDALHINTLAFEGPEVRLSRENKEAPLNVQFILENINRDKNKDNNTDLRINQLLIYDGRFSYDVLSESHITDRLDHNHIAINEFSCNISLKDFNRESLNIYIRSVKGHEKSGLELKKIRAHIKAKDDRMIFTGLLIELPGSNLKSDSIEISNICDSLPLVSFNGELSSEYFSFKDISPVFSQFSKDLPELSFDIKGSLSNNIAQGEVNITTDDGSFAFFGKTKVTHPYLKSRNVEAHVDRLNIKKDAIEKLTSFFEDAPDGIASMLGDTQISGDFFYSTDSIDCQADIICGNGEIQANLRLDSCGNYTLVANGNNINLGAVLNYRELEKCNLEAISRGNINKKNNLADFDIRVNSLRFKKYTYAPIKITGKAGKGSLKATMLTSDPNIGARIAIDCLKEQNGAKIALQMKVDSFIPKELNLGNSFHGTFAFNAECEHRSIGKRKSLTNVKIRNFSHNDREGESKIRNLYVYDDNTGEKRSITVNSDILTADIVGEFNLSNLHESFLWIARTHIPSLQTRHKNKKLGNNYIYRIEILDSKLLTKLFNLPFTINERSVINGACNDGNNTFGIIAEINNINIGSTPIRAINIKGSSSKENLAFEADILKPTIKDKKTFNYNNTTDDVLISLRSEVDNDTINSTINWGSISNTGNSNGSLQLDVLIGRDKKNNLIFDAGFIPSSFTLNGHKWSITPGKIYGNSSRFHVNNLQLYSHEQSLKIDGTAGKFIDDSLNIEIKNLDVATIMGLTNFRVLKFGGRATGKGHITSLLHNIDVNALFNVDTLLIEGARMGNCDLALGWMNYNKTLTLDGDIHRGIKTSKVSGFLSKPQDTIMLKIDANDLNIGFLHNKINAFISEAEGTANGTAYIAGQWSKVNLTGTVALDCNLKVKANNCTYTVDGDTIYMSPNAISFRDIDIKDTYGNRGKLTGDLNHRHFSQWKCNLNVKADNMLVYDTHGFDNLPFYGTVFATGTANINSTGNGLTLKANLRSEANSKFVYNSTAASGARDNSFVTFTDSRKKSASRSKEETEGKNKSTYSLVTSMVNLDFLLDITEAFHIKVYTNLKTDDYIDFYGKGTINALYDEKNGFSMKGGLLLDRGTYKFTIQDIFPKEFRIENGSSLAFDGDPFKAGLNLRTKYLVHSASLSDLTTETSNKKTVKVNCIMNIGGTLESPALDFDLELPEGNEEEKELLASVASTPDQKNMQFIYLLGVGKFYTFDYNKTGNNSQSSTAMESLLSNTLSGQLNNMLAQIIDDDNWDISGNFSTSERGWNSMEVEGMLSGRLLDNRLLINGNLGYRENPIANSSFIGDFEIQWLLNKKGNINLRAYSKTNDRYFSKTNLTTQGAGILFKFDFEKWKWWKKDDE